MVQIVKQAAKLAVAPSKKAKRQLLLVCLKLIYGCINIVCE
jgi:hypothetical protein